MKMPLAVSLALLVLALTLIISSATGQPEGLFLSRSTIGILIRFVISAPILVAPIAILPIVLASVVNLGNGFFGQFVKTKANPHHEFDVSLDLVVRPSQGIALSMLFAEKFLNFLEYSTGTSYVSIVVRSTVFAFMMVNPLISLFLSFIWALDDLGVRIFDRKTGEVRMPGSIVGTILPLIAGAVGVSSLFRRTFFVDALIDLLGVFMVLYPPYALFIIFYHELVRRRGAALSERLLLERVETTVKKRERGRIHLFLQEKRRRAEERFVEMFRKAKKRG